MRSLDTHHRLRFLRVLALLVFVCAYGRPAFATESYKFERMWPTLQQPWYFVTPNGVAVDSAGNVYVADSDYHRIQKFTSEGQFISQWGTPGSGDGQFNEPHGIAVDGSGNVYVADYGNQRIQKFTSNGQFITKWGPAVVVRAVHVSARDRGGRQRQCLCE